MYGTSDGLAAHEVDLLETIYDPTAGPFEKESFADIRKRLNG
jgi:hypothetical protein